MRALAPVVQPTEPAEGAAVARGDADFLREGIDARKIGVRVVEPCGGRSGDRQSAVVTLFVPPSVIESGKGCERRVRELPVDLERGAVVVDLLVHGVLG